MIDREYIQNLPEGLGILYTTEVRKENPYSKHAMFLHADNECVRVVTEYGAFAKLLMKNYGKTWCITGIVTV